LAPVPKGENESALWIHTGAAMWWFGKPIWRAIKFYNAYPGGWYSCTLFKYLCKYNFGFFKLFM